VAKSRPGTYAGTDGARLTQTARIRRSPHPSASGAHLLPRWGEGRGLELAARHVPARIIARSGPCGCGGLGGAPGLARSSVMCTVSARPESAPRRNLARAAGKRRCWRRPRQARDRRLEPCALHAGAVALGASTLPLSAGRDPWVPSAPPESRRTLDLVRHPLPCSRRRKGRKALRALQRDGTGGVWGRWELRRVDEVS
jgi:hypothetical protein